MQFMAAKCMIDDTRPQHIAESTLQDTPASAVLSHVLNKQLVTANPTEHGAQNFHEKPIIKQTKHFSHEHQVGLNCPQPT